MVLEEAQQYALCLNMIVKDESHIIKDTLTKLLQKIKFDYWVISDTGSTDKTKEIITDFFKEVGIPGELYEDEWVDFSHNRNKALEYAFGKSKYLLIFDADDEICGDFVLPELVKDYYQFQFGSYTKYTRTQIVNNCKRWKYVGVLHECIVSNNDDRINVASMEVIKGHYYTVSGRSGNRNLDSNKYLKDAIILEKAYYNAVDAKDDIYNRYGFYCANSYYDCDKYEDAISWYKKTLENCGWSQEKYVSCLKLYKCYEKMNNIEAGFFYLVKSAEYDIERAECYYELIKYYSGSGSHDVAYGYYGVLRNFYNNSYLKDGLNNKLFLDESVSEFYLPYYVIIVSEKMRDYDTGIQMYRIVFTKKCKCFDEWFIGNLLYNLQFFTEHVKDEDKTAFYSLFQEYVDFIVAKNYPLVDENMKIYEKYGIKKREASIATDDKCLTSKKILIYTGFMDYLWNDTYVSNNPIGGAEKAVAYLARNLPKEYEIIISGDVADEVVGNVKYVNRFNLQALLDVEKFHTIIVSRYVSFFLLFPRFNCHQLYLSAHDSTGFLNNFNGVPVHTIIEENNKYIKGVICLTTWHKLNTIQTHACLKDKVFIINNGILVAGATSNKKLSHNKIKNKFVWTSCSYRGLDVMLKLWDEILEVMPDATLDISSYDAFPCNKKDEEIQMIINRHSDSVKHHGKLNTLQLHDLISKAEYWLYTNTFCETSCITAFEMLMHEVVCLYYPLAGLVDTIGEYGIQVNSGNEIQIIMNLSEAKKVEMRINGKKYAMSCSWENRAKEWASVLGLGLNILKKKKKVGIFNSFPFHYEMFGFILNYAKNNNYEVDIFTNQTNTIGWLEFYRETFDNFNIIDFNKFNGRADEYTTFFVTTDDDTKFNSEWVRDNVICINHYYKIRTPNFKNYLNVANFKDSILECAYPCYPLINHLDKNQSNSICIIGGGNIHHKHNVNVINRLQSNGRIKLNIFVRKICNTNISELDINKFDINFIEDGTTSTMMKILKQSSYVLINYNNNEDHNNGISCSGSLQLALSTLCRPIIVDSANKHLQINNALEYDVNSGEHIFIDNEINFQLLEQERNKYVDNFDKYTKNILSTLKVINNFKHDKVNISLLKDIKEYKPIYQQFLHRSECEIMFRKIIYDIMPYFKDKNIIDLGAYIGDNSITWAMNSTGIIYAIDPSKENTDFIDKMAKHNGLDNIVTITKAISDKCEIIYYNEMDSTHITCNTDNGNSYFEAVSLDSLNLENIGFIHLDVEGFEYKVLNGSINIITKYNPVVVWENHIEKEDYMKIVNFFSYHKYTTYMINEQFPHCHPDCRNFISFPENCNISVNEINNKFKEVYTEFTPDKKSPLLICIKSNITSDIPNKNIIKIDSNNKNLCLLTYGQFRTFKNNFRNNLLELYPVHIVYENVYIFILLDECLSQEESVNTKYKENCDYIENICKEFNIKIGFIQDINNLNYKHEETNYCSKLLLQKSDDKQFPNDFVLNLLYRKYKLIELVEEYCIDHKVDISDILHCRLFDVIIKKNTSVITIINNFKNTDSKKTIYFSPDTIFFGNHNLIKKIMKFENIYNSDELWNNKDFCNFSYKFDSILTNNKHTYAPEIQYTANMYFKSVDAINLRYFKPDPNCLDANLMYEVMLDHNRGYSNTFDIKKKSLNLNLTREYIVELNNTIDSTYLDYFNESGLNDYKQKIGSEHYKLLCAISSQISNGIIIDIGTHNGNSAIALGYNLYKNKNNILDRSMLYTFDIKDFKSESFKKFMNNYCVHSSLENIFDYTVREKYKNVLLESELILIDVDPHNGVLEYELYSWLFENNYEGIILFDDIFLEKGHTANNYDSTYQSMKIFWNKIPDKYKLDITHLGHWSGTGLVSFNTNKNIINLDSNNIPKKIFQTWETADIEPEFQQIIDKWKYHNPTYEYIFQDAEQRVEFIRNNFEKNVLDAYKKIIPGAYKCDLWRYCILYIYGGFYADIDTLCMGKLDSLTNENIEFIVPIDLNINQKEGQHNLACGFIGSVPKSPILLDAINRIIFNVENNIIPESKLDFSGPGLLGRSVNNFLKLHETNSFKGKEGIQNNINFLEFDANTEYMRDVYTNINILQNKNRNSDIIRLYNNECNKIKNYACWLSDNVINKNL
jgi:FkbM family methyltransferase